MPVYRYVALNRRGREEKGVLDAESPSVARRSLRLQGVYVRRLTVDTEKKGTFLSSFSSLSTLLKPLLQRVPRRDVGLFARRLGILLEAGLSLDRSLANIIGQTENQQLKLTLIKIRADVVEGEALSRAMEKHPVIFPPIYSNLVLVGEKTGTYEKSLLRLAELEDANEKMRTKITNAATYPAIMLFLLMGIMMFLLTVVFPKIRQLFIELDADLPIITRVVMGVSDIFTSSWLFVILAVIGGGLYYFYRWKSQPAGRLRWEQFLIDLPVIGRLQCKILLARFTRNLGVMLESRVPLIMALQVVSRLVSHQIFSAEIGAATEKIKEGVKISDAFRGSPIVSPMALGMLAAGEASDSVPEMVNKVADVMERDVESSIEKSSVLLEPAMIVVLGLLIILMMVSILLPMYDLTRQIEL